MKNIAVLGSTGSIGVNALNIIEQNPERFKVTALVARNNIKALAKQIEKFSPKIVCVSDTAKAETLRSLISKRVKIVHGEKGAVECASGTDADMVVSAIVGSAGLVPTMSAITAGIDIALANKEVMVTAGELVMKEARRCKVKIIPIDSEHSAIFQVLRGEKRKNIRKIILTASGGPFLNRPIKALEKISPAEALKHPNWNMGSKISIDSATMMNKGLEVIEAKWLFNLSPEKIDVLVHPQSIIHSMVEFCDSSVVSQMGLPDMRVPIAFALGYPDRMELKLENLDLASIGKLSFKAPNTKKFPALRLAYEAIETSKSAPAVLNGANEVAVDAFLKKKIRFTDIPRIVEKTMNAKVAEPVTSVEEALEWDRWARSEALRIIKMLS